MIRVNLITLGRLKEKYLAAACDEYKKRLSRYCDLNIVEIEPEKLPESPSDALIESALLKESARIEGKIPKGSFTVALCIEGKSISSEDLAERVKDLEAAGRPISFVIGSSFGLHKTVKQRADFCLSVSPMTFPHQLFRVMLLEQIYRAFKINGGGTYHK